jgi:hypothetical protein
MNQTDADVPVLKKAKAEYGRAKIGKKRYNPCPRVASRRTAGSWKVVRKKESRILLTATWKLSKDGDTLTDDFTAIQPNGSPFNLKYVYKRMAGTSGFAGTWERTSETVNSFFVLQVRPYEGDGLSFIDPLSRRDDKREIRWQGLSECGPERSPGLCVLGPPGEPEHSGNDRQDQRQDRGHPADRAFFRSQDLDDNRAHSRPK